ncbi:MAG: YggS family pyridoxal phosphate-dependent enzyme [Bacteroidaceae bacterium]|nr:YggS family pyridoxal phosphate-dependent enzyme [Bacteroidaceae bacterium]
MQADIKKSIERISATLPSGVTLIAVSKYHPIEAIEEAYSAGQRHFGESKAQDLRIKQQMLPKDICWHFIGHLQSNKIKYIAPYIYLIHSIDSLRLLQEVDRQGAKVGRTIDCLLQIHIAREETKFGFTPEECRTMLDEGEWCSLPNVRIRGLMCMASNTDNKKQIKEEFHAVKELFDEIRAKHFADTDSFDILSAGMSDDYPIAIEEGSTHIRIGSDIFGTPQK